MGLSNTSSALNETGSVQPVNIKTGEEVVFWQVIVGTTPVLLMGMAPNAGKRACMNYSGAKEVWIGSSSVVTPQINSWPIFIKDKYETNNSARLYGLVEAGQATVLCTEER